jgi:hypothetical protein
MAMLATSRLTSHSQGPGSVSSKSLTSKTRFLSGDAYRPKFETCASPHNCAVSPVSGADAKSEAISRAAPRKNAKRDGSIRPYRTGSRSAIRDAACDSSRSTGSWRFCGAMNSASEDLGITERRARPRSRRCSTDASTASPIPGAGPAY